MINCPFTFNTKMNWLILFLWNNFNRQSISAYETNDTTEKPNTTNDRAASAKGFSTNDVEGWSWLQVVALIALSITAKEQEFSQPCIKLWSTCEKLVFNLIIMCYASSTSFIAQIFRYPTSHVCYDDMLSQWLLCVKKTPQSHNLVLAEL